MKSQSRNLYYATLEREPRVLEYDNEGTEGFMVTLVKGFAFYDAAGADEDPEGAMACHGATYPTVREAMSAIKSAQPCRCGRCIR